MEPVRVTFRAMACAHKLALWHADAAHARRIAEAVVADVHRIEAKYSRYRDDSVVSVINRSAGRAPVPIDPETVALLRYGAAVHELSGGRFDVTSGVLRRVWDWKRAPPVLPDSAALAAAVALIGWGQVELDDASVRLPRPGMEIDFGGIGKEYAADRAAAICLDGGIVHGLVNLGGDVRVVGPRPDGSRWRIGIRHPRRDGEAIAAIELADGAVATSGDYERFVEIDGRRYCHLLDPATGWPVDHWQSITVVAPLCVVAGSHATAAMLAGPGAVALLVDASLRWLGVDASGALAGSLTAG